MTRKTFSLKKFAHILAGTALILCASARGQDKAADPTGTWIWTTPGRNGGPDRTNTLTLKLEDSKLTGTISAPGRGGQAVETPVSDIKVDGDNISFDIVRHFNGNSTTNKYSGKIADGKITGKMEYNNRNGEAQSRDWKAQRTEDKK